jgi:glutamyl-tRNA reductase
LLVDAKRIRHRHLEGLGSQSYGGLVRHHLKGVPAVAVLGAGQLANEILPWLIGKSDVTLFYRNQLRVQTLLEEYPQVRLDQFTTETAANLDDRKTALIIAAPLAAAEIENWISLQSTPFVKLLDLRGEAATDPIQVPFSVVRLSELFAAVKSDQPRLAARLAAARAEIQLAAERQAGQAQFRPFGWEDLCA